MASDCSTRKVNSVVCFVVILSVCLCAFAVRLPFKARVTSIKVMPPVIENKFLSVPKIMIGVKVKLIIGISGGELSSGMQIALTKESAKHGEVCNSDSFLSSMLESYKNNYISFNETKFVLFLADTNIFKGLKKVYVCVSPKSGGPSNGMYFHLGKESEIIIDDGTYTSIRKRYGRSSREQKSLPEGAAPFGRVTSGGTGSSLKQTKWNRNTRGSEFMTLHSGYRTKREADRTNNSTMTTNLTLSSDKSASSSNSDSIRLFTHNDSQLSIAKLLSDPYYMRAQPLVNSELTYGATVFGIRVKSHSKGISYDEQTIQLQADFDAEIQLFGERLTQNVSIQFTAYEDDFGGRCDVSTSNVFPLSEANGHTAIAVVRLPVMSPSQKLWYLCIRDSASSVAVHQGNDRWLTISTYSLFMPIWIQIIFLVILLLLSGLFSGLNLGLMALDKTELKIVRNTGTPTERRYAKAIEPVRRHGNFLLCTLLLGNVLVNSTLTIVLDTLSTGLIAVIGSTISIVIFGEIVPQAICSRHGLAIGAKTVWLVRIFMVITGPIAWPVSKILDLLLGEEIGSTYDRERLKELIRVTQDRNELRQEEQNIICGALELHRKTVAEVMTKIDDVYMLSIDSYLDFHAISKIMEQGYSRIPIYEGEKNNIVSVLFIKDLAFIDPDDNTPLRTVSQFYQNVCNFVFEDTTLDVLFKDFKEGNKGHMAFVQRVNNEGECDPFYEVVGLVTLEDVIEELIQEEIVDETDVFTDNKSRRRRRNVGRRDFKEFSHPNANSHQRKYQISPQLQVAAFQYLRTTIEPCKEGHLSEGVLRRMLTQDIIHVIKPNAKEKGVVFLEDFIYQQGKPVDYFVLILEGHVEVKIGKENLTFDSGPFTYFGLAALANATIGESPSLPTQLSRSSMVGSAHSLDVAKFSFIPDYSVKASTEVTFLKIRRSHYLAARRAYLLECSQKDPLPEETFEKEMEKILRDEILNSSAFDIDIELDTSSKDWMGKLFEKKNNRVYPDASQEDTLLNGQAVRSKSDQDQVEISIFNSLDNSRRSSLKCNNEASPIPENGLSLGSSPSTEDLRPNGKNDESLIT